MLLELLKGIVRSLRQGVEAGGVKVSSGNMAMAVREERVGRDGVVG